MKRELVLSYYARTLMDLCERRELASLRVADVVEASGMSKPTFYRYFSGLPLLVNYTASRSFLEGPHPLFTRQNILGAYLFASQHPAFFLQLPAQEGTASFKEANRRWLRRKGYALYLTDALPAPERLRRKVQFDFFLTGSLDAMEAWLADRMRLPAREVADAVASMMPPFMSGPGAPVAGAVELGDYPG